jgi:aspartate racemase
VQFDVVILGVVGGIAPLSTIEYYRLLIHEYRQTHPSGEYPQILINSINLRDMLRLCEAGQPDRAAACLTKEVARLADGGADMALFASTIPHLVFDQIEAVAPIPVLSIVRAARDAAVAMGLRRVLLLGNRLLTGTRVYQTEFEPAGLEIVVPVDPDIEFVDRIYQTELIYGIFHNATRHNVQRVIDRAAAAHDIDGVILGGTEFPLLLPMASYGGYPFLDTSRIHVARAIAECWPSPIARLM